MAAENITPDVAALAAAVGLELVFAQVLIRKTGEGFELRHVADAGSEAGKLQLLKEHEIRALAQFTGDGSYRALRSAPTLRGGWRVVSREVSELGTALDLLYPGAVADWYRCRWGEVPVTSYRDFTGRQTGMYRITTHLEDGVAGAMVRACCAAEFCLKRRLWSLRGLTADAAAEKSVIPCLEPCAILLEFARKMARLEQQESPAVSEESGVNVAECDFESPNNPRRRRFILEKELAAGKR